MYKQLTLALLFTPLVALSSSLNFELTPQKAVEFGLKIEPMFTTLDDKNEYSILISVPKTTDDICTLIALESSLSHQDRLVAWHSLAEFGSNKTIFKGRLFAIRDSNYPITIGARYNCNGPTRFYDFGNLNHLVNYQISKSS